METQAQFPSRYPPCLNATELHTNLLDIQQRIDAACDAAGRDRTEVRLMPVTKTVNDERLVWAAQAGVRRVGENKVQEAQHKATAFADAGGLEWAMIGHLQTNKVGYVAESAMELHSLDRLKLARALQRRLDEHDRHLEVFVQVNSSGETSKYGLDPSEVVEFVAQLDEFPRLQLRGLMTLALHSDDQDRVRDCFILMRNLRDQLHKQGYRQQGEHEGDTLELSMGMSGDYELAIAEGATTIRIGQAIFGARPIPDSHYWPSSQDN